MSCGRPGFLPLHYESDQVLGFRHHKGSKKFESDVNVTHHNHQLELSQIETDQSQIIENVSTTTSERTRSSLMRVTIINKVYDAICQCTNQVMTKRFWKSPKFSIKYQYVARVNVASCTVSRILRGETGYNGSRLDTRIFLP